MPPQLTPTTPVAPPTDDGPLTQSTLDKSIARLESKLEMYAKPVGFIVAGMIVVLFLGFIATLVSLLGLVIESNTARAIELRSLNEKLDRVDGKLTPTVLKALKL